MTCWLLGFWVAASAALQAQPAPPQAEVFVLTVSGMVWEECRHSVEEALQKVRRVVAVEVDLGSGQVTVRARPGEVGAEELAEAVKRATDSSGHAFTAAVTRKRLRPVPDLDSNVRRGPEVGTHMP